MKKLIFALLTLAITGNIAIAQYSNQKIEIGQPAPELAYKNPDDQVIKLSEINKDRYVLIDFWASWCGPCRRANPRVVELYNKYKDQRLEGAKKGFTIVSVSLDKDKGKWVQAIEKDGLLWEYHMSDLGAWGSEAAQIYGVGYIPQAFLIGPDGKVIAKYNAAEQAEKELEQRVKERKKFLGLF